GLYVLTGTTTHSVIITASGEVSLLLSDAVIQTSDAAAIIGKNQSNLYIYLADDSTNTISDAGTSILPAAIYSNSDLTIEGIGILNVNGNQIDGDGIITVNSNLTINNGVVNVKSVADGLDSGGTLTINGGTIYVNASDDGINASSALLNGGNMLIMGANSGISTDNGYNINDGIVVIVGTSTLEAPKTTSEQIALCFDFGTYISANKVVSLVDSTGETAISFLSAQSFKNIVMSKYVLTYNEYNLYSGGSDTGILTSGLYYSGTYTPGTLIGTYTINSIVNSY
ncbi:MAG TPA: carbohydrate-binding domain-containing protein, partial [Bacilli bacterium]|nr:carbohydrate-binding domain-containing protein [Bacilli bacterium]